MPNKRKIATPQTPQRSVSAGLIDYVFGERLPQPEVVEHDSEQAWQEWLSAKARQDSVVEFEDTQPMATHETRRPARS